MTIQTTTDVQNALNQMGYRGADGQPLTVDGIVGPNTTYAIQQFQMATDPSNPNPTGVADALTMQAMDQVIANMNAGQPNIPVPLNEPVIPNPPAPGPAPAPTPVAPASLLGGFTFPNLSPTMTLVVAGGAALLLLFAAFSGPHGKLPPPSAAPKKEPHA